MYTEVITRTCGHVKVHGGRARHGAVAGPELLQGRLLGSDLVGKPSVKPRGFSKNCISIASILSILRSYRFGGEKPMNILQGAVKPLRHHLDPLSQASRRLPIQSLPKYYFQIPFPFSFHRTLLCTLSTLLHLG